MLLQETTESNVSLVPAIICIYLIRRFHNQNIFIHLIAFVYFYPGFSESLLWIGLPWAITAPLFLLLLAIHFVYS